MFCFGFTLVCCLIWFWWFLLVCCKFWLCFVVLLFVVGCRLCDNCGWWVCLLRVGLGIWWCFVRGVGFHYLLVYVCCMFGC